MDQISPQLRYQVLRRADLPVDTMEMARFLIGKILVRDTKEGRASGRIVETEGYPLGDASSHAYNGETPRVRSMFQEAGRSYVYFTYGAHFCFNVSSEPFGVGAGVLIRALEPLEGIELMERRRGTAKRLDLARGPGRLAAALDIDRKLDGIDLCREGPLWLARDDYPASKIGKSVRIGISREAHRLCRFYARGNPYVSGPRRLSP